MKPELADQWRLRDPLLPNDVRLPSWSPLCDVDSADLPGSVVMVIEPEHAGWFLVRAWALGGARIYVWREAFAERM